MDDGQGAANTATVDENGVTTITGTATAQPADIPQQSSETPPAENPQPEAVDPAPAQDPEPVPEQPADPVDVHAIAREAAAIVIEALTPAVQEIADRVKALEERTPPDATGIKEIKDGLAAITARINALGLH